MIIVELMSVLLAPAAGLFAPVIFTVIEVIFWLALFLVQIFVALLRRRKPEFPERPRLSKLRENTKSFASKWREKRKSKKAKSEIS